jgi:hypothetical protein
MQVYLFAENTAMKQSTLLNPAQKKRQTSNIQNEVRYLSIYFWVWQSKA